MEASTPACDYSRYQQLITQTTEQIPETLFEEPSDIRTSRGLDFQQRRVLAIQLQSSGVYESEGGKNFVVNGKTYNVATQEKSRGEEITSLFIRIYSEDSFQLDQYSTGGHFVRDHSGQIAQNTIKLAEILYETPSSNRPTYSGPQLHTNFVKFIEKNASRLLPGA